MSNGDFEVSVCTDGGPPSTAGTLPWFSACRHVMFSFLFPIALACLSLLSCLSSYLGLVLPSTPLEGVGIHVAIIRTRSAGVPLSLGILGGVGFLNLEFVNDISSTHVWNHDFAASLLNAQLRVCCSVCALLRVHIDP